MLWEMGIGVALIAGAFCVGRKYAKCDKPVEVYEPQIAHFAMEQTSREYLARAICEGNEEAAEVLSTKLMHLRILGFAQGWVGDPEHASCREEVQRSTAQWN